jgi:pyrroloquinoline quinone (PQQ) biosynthesis protein C
MNGSVSASQVSAGSERASFELQLRMLADAKFRRDVTADNPFARLHRGELPLAEVQAVYSGMLESIWVFNRVLLSRVLAMAPSVEARTALLPVVSVEFGPPIENAHPVILQHFLRKLGLSEEVIAEPASFGSPDAVREAETIRQMTWLELLARLLVGETMGPKVFAAIADALRKSYGLAKEDVFYFYLHAQHDRRDVEILFSLIARHAVNKGEREQVLRTMNRSYDEGRYRLYGCALAGANDYQYAARVSRHTSEA